MMFIIYQHSETFLSVNSPYGMTSKTNIRITKEIRNFMLNQDVDTTTKARVTNEYDSRKRILHDKISIFNSRAPLFLCFPKYFSKLFHAFCGFTTTLQTLQKTTMWLLISSQVLVSEERLGKVEAMWCFLDACKCCWSCYRPLAI